jgi:formate dehydrogenase iron-sulfur subunit
MRIYVPRDTTALALGADAVAQAIADGVDPGEVTLVRNGSRGAFFLEPLVEVERGDQRLALGPMTAEDVPGLLALLREDLSRHPRYLGPVASLPWLARQTRMSFARAGLDDPLCLEHYQRQRGFAGLERALHLPPEDLVEEIRLSGLRGRGGAAFPAGIKWDTVRRQAAPQKYVVCNADEGDSGTFADRLLVESDPYQLIEGMIIAGLAVGATRGYIYLRSEYPQAWQVLHTAIAKAEAAGFLGENLCGSQHDFYLELRLGAGAYICGEETALLESLEGRRGAVRVKPPLPAQCGLFGTPTLIHNVLSLAAVTTILSEGAEAYAALGSGRSQGTLTVQLAGNICRGGLVEVPFGASLRELLHDYGGGSYSGRPLRAVQVGGPLGAYLPESQWDTALTYEAFADIGAMLGHGGVVAFDDTVDMADQARFAMEFCAVESCGKCTPCRIGAVRGVELLDHIATDAADTTLLQDLCETMEEASLCAMGGLTPQPVRSALTHFAEDFR